MEQGNSGDDRSLVERAQAGDREAFGELVRRYHRRVYLTALQLTHNHSDADDLAQEAFLKAFRALSGFDGRSDFFTWLYRITVNTSLNYLKRAHRTKTTYTTDEELIHHAIDRLLPAQSDPRSRAEARQLYRRVLEALQGLKPELSVGLVLHAVQGFSHREVAAMMDCPEGTVAWRISEARRQLKNKLRRVLRGPSSASTDELLEDKTKPPGLS